MTEEMKSRINGEGIPEDEHWVWDTHNGHIISWGHNGYDPCCPRCRRTTQELFQFNSITSPGAERYCYDCVMEIRLFIDGSFKFARRLQGENAACKVCGFDICSYVCGGGSSHKTCVFRHTEHSWPKKTCETCDRQRIINASEGAVDVTERECAGCVEHSEWKGSDLKEG